MWCRNCQQDVPGVAAAEDESELVCLRCRQTLTARLSAVTDPSEAESSYASAAPSARQFAIPDRSSRPATFAGAPDIPSLWNLDTQHRSVERVLRAIDVLQLDDEEEAAEPVLPRAAASATSTPVAPAGLGWLWLPLSCSLTCGVSSLLLRLLQLEITSWLAPLLSFAGQVALAAGLIRVAKRVSNLPSAPQLSRDVESQPAISPEPLRLHRG